MIAKKGNPQFGSVDRALDCDVLVSEMRETSRKSVRTPPLIPPPFF